MAFVLQGLAKVKLTCVYSAVVAAAGRAGLGTVPGESCHRNVTPLASRGAQIVCEG